MGRDDAGRVHRQVAGLGVEGERGAAVALQRSLPVAPLADGAIRDKLKWAMSDPECLRPGETRQTVTEGSARRRTSRSLRKACGTGTMTRRGGCQHFVNRLVFCMFAQDVGLPPADMFTKMLEQARSRPASFEPDNAIERSDVEQPVASVPAFERAAAPIGQSLEPTRSRTGRQNANARTRVTVDRIYREIETSRWEELK